MAAPAAATGVPVPLTTAQPVAQPPAQPPAQLRPSPAPVTTQQQAEEPAGNIYAAPAQQRRSDIEELLSLNVTGPTYTEPTPTTQPSSKWAFFLSI